MTILTKMCAMTAIPSHTPPTVIQVSDDDGAVIEFRYDTHQQSPELTAGRFTSCPEALGEGIAGVGTADG